MLHHFEEECLIDWMDGNRYHTVQEFNKGVYDYIIATDESGARGELDEEVEVEPSEPVDGGDECESFVFTQNKELTHIFDSHIHPTRLNNSRRRR